MIETRPRTAAIVNLGCKVNQSEMEAAARLLREAAIPLVDAYRGADLVLVNTCTVTATADEKSPGRGPPGTTRKPRGRHRRDGLLGAGRAGGVRGGGRGRAPGRQRGQGRVPRGARGPAAARRARPPAASIRALPTLSGVEAVAAEPLDGIADDRASVERTRAFVKVQDGCSFFCTYCIIPRARGAERSLAAGRACSRTCVGRWPPATARSS